MPGYDGYPYYGQSQWGWGGQQNTPPWFQQPWQYQYNPFMGGGGMGGYGGGWGGGYGGYGFDPYGGYGGGYGGYGGGYDDWGGDWYGGSNQGDWYDPWGGGYDDWGGYGDSSQGDWYFDKPQSPDYGGVTNAPPTQVGTVTQPATATAPTTPTAPPTKAVPPTMGGRRLNQPKMYGAPPVKPPSIYSGPTDPGNPTYDPTKPVNTGGATGGQGAA